MGFVIGEMTEHSQREAGGKIVNRRRVQACLPGCTQEEGFVERGGVYMCGECFWTLLSPFIHVQQCQSMSVVQCHALFSLLVLSTFSLHWELSFPIHKWVQNQ
jgi:hypothetical protein